MTERGKNDLGALDEVAETACAAGPVFRSKFNRDGTSLRFCDVHPDAPRWVHRLAAWVEQH